MLLYSPNIDLNVVTKIGVKADGTCKHIEVDLNTCLATINGNILNSREYSKDVSWFVLPMFKPFSDRIL